MWTGPKTCSETEAQGNSEMAYLYSPFLIKLFRQRLSHKSEKAYATMSISIMGSKR